MRWLLAKDRLGYTLYEEKQIEKREEKLKIRKIALDYEICVSSSTLIIYLMHKRLKDISEKIEFKTENLSEAELTLAELIIKEHNKLLNK